MKKLLNQIVKSKSKCVFVSPHFDDAVFSAGGVIQELVKNGVSVTVINIFTACGTTSNSLSAKVYLKQCGYDNARVLYKDREIEDASTFKTLKIKHINLGFTDALWRTKPMNLFMKYASQIIPELGLIYPTYRWHISTGKVSNYDIDTVNSIVGKINSIKEFSESKYVFAPIGIGNHVDHLVTNKVIKKYKSNKKILLWGDYPYVLKHDIKKERLLNFAPDWFKKEILLRKYTSQFKAIFGNLGVSKIDEIYKLI